MFGVKLAYATPSAYESQKERALLGLAADAHRSVRFQGKVKPRHTFLLRTVLRAFGELIWSTDYWSGFYDSHHLDPVITVHPDKIFLEAFSRDQSVHGMVAIDHELFESREEPRYGTSNISFTAWLWAALGEMRSSRATWLHLDSGGLELTTLGAGGRFEKVVEVPDSWLRGFLQLQHAMTIPGTHISARPADLLAAIRFLRYSKARTSPRALRYELEPGQDARIVLEPWEQSFPLRGTSHGAEKARLVRTWGRQRLKLLEPVLPFADSVDIWLKGRAMPSFYQANLPGLSFLLGLSGGRNEEWTSEDGQGYDLLELPSEVAADHKASALGLLRERHQVSYSELCDGQGLSKGEAQAVLSTLCREGHAFYHLATRSYRHRPLFDQPIDLDKIFPPNPRLEKARAYADAGEVRLASCVPRETRKIKRLPGASGPTLREVIHRDWCLSGQVGDQEQVEVILSDTDRIIFARCGCSHFQEQLMARGPCAHMLALRWAGQKERQDLPTSVEAQEE